ncbi:hypothetical protein [Parasitella parasitica]|uniref:Serine/threonine-protein kinase n=1 Tax=Parasitella parasitica TaxID=35722 RepID=A0A0B7N7U9_9FUNG|nr:hypothetical protein [Parasitella parasitica]
MSSPAHRKTRIQSLNSRLSSQQQQQRQQRLCSQEQADRMNDIKVTIPPSLSREMGLAKGSVAAVAEAGLRPLQTNNSRKALTSSQKDRLKPLQQVMKNNPIDPVNQRQQPVVAVQVDPELAANQQDGRKQRHQKQASYKLVEDRDVPPVIKDYKRRVQYRKLECLGFGAFGRVYRVQSLHDGKYWAAKVISKSSVVESNTKKKLLAEINIHRSLKHDNIVRTMPEQGRYGACGRFSVFAHTLQTLSSMLKRRGGTLTELETRYYMGQILTALRYMSDNRILHRDLKLSNVLLDRNMDCKLGDFGLAALLTVCGTLHYIAPEILFHKEVDGHNHRVDMWSAGVLMYNLLFGKHPFQVTEAHELRIQVKQNEYQQGFKFPVDSFVVSPEAKSLISGLLVNDPDRRLSVIEALQHPFFSMEIPTRIPRLALESPPSYQDLFAPSDTQHSASPRNKPAAIAASKVTAAIRNARDIDKCYEDLDIQPPLIIMNETIYDPRSQYPLPNSQKSAASMLLPQPAAAPTALVKNTTSTSTTSKRRAANSNESIGVKNSAPVPPKRLCNDGDIKSTIPASMEKSAHRTQKPSPSLILADKLESTQISSPKIAVSSPPPPPPPPPSSTSPSRNVGAATASEVIATTSAIKQPSSLKTKFDSQGFAIPTALPIRRPLMEQMEENIKIMIARSESVLKENRSEAKPNVDFQWLPSNLFIETWVDCSKHYGFAYRLSDGTLGFLFNDGSVLSCCDSSAYYYVSYRAEDDRYVEQIYNSVPAELEKKARLLQKFGSYEQKELKHDQTIPKTTQLNKTYLLKYYVDQEAITFRLSNGAVQLNFFKHHKLILYDAGRKLMFIDSSRKLAQYNTFDVLCSTNTEIINAIHYAFSILQAQNTRRQKALQEERWKRFEKE